MIRPGAGAVYLPVWHIDIFDFIDIKKKNGDERRRAVDLFPAVILDDVFMNRMINGEDYTLFDPYDVSDLNEKFGEDFKLAYEKYEEEFKNNPDKFNKNTKTISTKKVMLYIINSYYENGTPFLFFKDNVNRAHEHPDLGIIRTSNLCCFTGDTKVYVLEDENKGLLKSYNLATLTKWSNENKEFKVLSARFDKETNTWIKEAKPARAFKTGVKKIITLILTNSDMVSCTPDHKFALPNGEYKEAKDLLGETIVGYSEKGCDTIVVGNIVDNNDVLPVYDLEVDDNHNFYIKTRDEDHFLCSSGLLVHNCEITIPTHDEITAVCNLGSINIAKCNTDEDLERTCKIAMRAMDNTIDLTKYPSERTRRAQELYRSTGLGALGLAEYLAVNHIEYGSKEHEYQLHRIFGKIRTTVDETSKELAKEKGSCVVKGIRNAYRLAIAPNSSSGIFASTTNSHEPLYSKLWLEGSKNDTFKLTAPNIQPDNEKYYKTAYEIDVNEQIRMTSIIQKYIDMSISFNLYFLPENISTKKVRDAIVNAWQSGLKTTYYLRTKAITNDNVKEEQITLTRKGNISCVGCEN